MDFITSKMFVIAAGILITIVIVTGTILAFSEVNNIFNTVQNTDTSIYNQFDNVYAQYDGAVLNTVALLNTLRKYEEDKYIYIIVSLNAAEELDETKTGKSTVLAKVEEKIEQNKIGYENLYNVSVKENNSQINIIFTYFK